MRSENNPSAAAQDLINHIIALQNKYGRCKLHKNFRGPTIEEIGRSHCSTMILLLRSAAACERQDGRTEKI